MAKIRSFRQIENLAKSLFPCYVQDGGFGDHAEGKRQIRLIVGKKVNPNYDEKATSGPASHKFEPDVRIIYVRPGEDESVVKELLLKIKKSLETKEPVIDPSITSMEKYKPTKRMTMEEELAIADKIAEGDNSLKGEIVDEWDDVDEWEDEQLEKTAAEIVDQEKEKQAAEELSKEEKQTPKKEEANKTEELMKEVVSAISTLNQNVQVLANDIKELSDKQQEQAKAIANIKNKVGQSKANKQGD